jgi:hypothetical protein
MAAKTGKYREVPAPERRDKGGIDPQKSVKSALG